MRTLFDFLSEQKLPYPIFSTQHGWGKVIRLRTNTNYPIYCNFGDRYEEYTSWGFRYIISSHFTQPELFLEEIDLTQNIPDPPLKVGDIVLWGDEVGLRLYEIMCFEDDGDVRLRDVENDSDVYFCKTNIILATEEEIDRRVQKLKECIKR